jgi:hypothetical protein
MTSGHCNKHDGSAWPCGDGVVLGKISASEEAGDKRDAAIIRLAPSVDAPVGDVGGQYSVRDVLSLAQIKVGMPFCKIGAVTDETCRAVKSTEGVVVEASVYRLSGGNSGPGRLMFSPAGDDYTTYFVPLAHSHFGC